MPIFLVNGFVRGPFLEIARPETWFYQLALGFCSLALSIFMARLLQASEELRSSFSPSAALERIF
jgi:hypothetical protein